MVKISIFYPNQPDGWFDMAYYLERHIPMTLERVGKHPGYRRVMVEEGMGGEQPGSTATYAAICSFEFDSKDSFLAAFEPNWPVIEADVPNYTNLEPTLEYYQIVSA